MPLLTGHRDHVLDGKDRLVIPSHFAAVLEAQSGGVVYLVPSAEMPCIEVYPATVYEGMASGQVPNRFEGSQQARRVFFQSAERVELKGPQRITLPKRLLTWFPAREVRVAGMNTYLELWHPPWWDEHVGKTLCAPPAPEAGPRKT
jgi:DNA-binding transcriptional regulator/RsmH inhibitor MraZ